MSSVLNFCYYELLQEGAKFIKKNFMFKDNIKLSNFLTRNEIELFCKIPANSFHATNLFLYPLKTSENQTFSDVFGGVWKENSGVKWVQKTWAENIIVFVFMFQEYLEGRQINQI